MNGEWSLKVILLLAERPARIPTLCIILKLDRLVRSNNMSAPIVGLRFWKRSTLLTFLANFHVATSLNVDLENRHNIYATKTAYDDAFTVEEKHARESIWTSKHADRCQPVQVNMVIRHGTRLPSSRDITNAKEVVERINGKITRNIFKDLNQWKVPFDEHEARALSPVGVKELYGIGRRVASNLPSLFSKINSNDIIFQSSSYARSIDSAKAFRREFLEGNSVTKDNIELEIRDDLLRFYDSCPKHIRDVEENKDASKEFHIFKNGPHMTGVAERMKAQLGLADEDFSYSKNSNMPKCLITPPPPPSTPPRKRSLG